MKTFAIPLTAADKTAAEFLRGVKNNTLKGDRAVKNPLRSELTIARFARLIVAILAGSLLTLPAGAQSPASASVPAPQHYRQTRVPKREANYYKLLWGVDSFAVKSTESGELIRFTYRVVDSSKANALNDKNSEPVLIDPKAGVQLVVPTMDKIGKLRQTASIEAGKLCWIAFSNKGGYVKRGDHVIVAIGSFRIDGLAVQ